MITIDPSNNPIYPPKPTDGGPNKSADNTATQKSVSECTSTEVATHITYYVSYDTDTDGRPIATTTTSTDASIVSGCSVTPVTVTASFTGTCTTCGHCQNMPPPGTALPYYDDDMAPDAADSSADLKKRLLGEADTSSHLTDPLPLEKRESALKYRILGSCNLGFTVVQPGWPNANQIILQKELNGILPANFASMSRFDKATMSSIGTNCYFTTTRLDAKAWQSATRVAYTPYGAKPTVGAQNNQLSMDHSCEYADCTSSRGH